MKMKLKRFNQARFLQRIGRELLTRFFGAFAEPLAGNGLTLPPLDLPDAQYFGALARLAAQPDCLPGLLNEALFAIDDLSTPEGFERIEGAPEWPALRSSLRPNSTREDIALQVWLVAPEVLARIHNLLRLKRLTVFEHAASRVPPEHRQPFDPQDRAAIIALTFDLDAWFAANHRGAETTRVEVYPVDGTFWFLIRHGDIFTRTPKVEQRNTEILHFRPERDDVVIYCPALDELRVNARTKGERDLYIRQFGRHLRRNADYFCDRATYTLEPLRTDGPDSLDTREINGVEKIRLRELEVASEDGQREVITRAAPGLFELAAMPEGWDPIPKAGRLARAIFDVQFTDAPRPYPVEICLPNILRISRRCDAQAVDTWLTLRRFRRAWPAVDQMQLAG